MINFRGLQLQKGDYLKVTVCENVEQSGKVIFKDAAYCLQYFYGGSYRDTPLTNYAHTCKFEKI